MTNDPHKRRQINKPTKQDKSKSGNSAKENLHANNKTNQKLHFFIAEPGKEADRKTSAKTTSKYMKNVEMY